MTDYSATSGFEPLAPTGISRHFTDFEEIPTGGVNRLVRAKRCGQYWVLKGLKPEFRSAFVYQELLRKEYDILCHVQHPGIVAVEALEEVEGIGLCIVMEWIDGETLEAWLTRPHKMREKRKIVTQLLEAMESIHRKQVVHRDLKPANIMVTRNGQNVKLIDFGLADTDSYAVFKQPAGTEGFISPEQSTGSTPDSRNDIYSIGSILLQMKMGWNYRRVARQCQGPLEKRFPDAYALNRAVHNGRRWQTLVCLLLTLAVLVGGVRFFYHKYYEPVQTYSPVADFNIGYLHYQSWGGGQVSVESTRDVDSCIEIPHIAPYRGIDYLVSEIGMKAFRNHRHLQRIILPEDSLHLLKDAFSGCTRLQAVYFRSATPPVIGNKIWPTTIRDVFQSYHFDRVTLYVPKGSTAAYRKSAWGIFKNIKEYT